MKKLLTILSITTLLMSFGAFAGELGTDMSEGVICSNEGKGLLSVGSEVNSDETESTKVTSEQNV